MGFGGGNDKRGRTRVAGATGALAAGTSRPRRRDLRTAALAGVGCAASPALKEAQALPARSYLPYRGPADPRHHRVGWVEFLRDPTSCRVDECWVSRSARPNLRLFGHNPGVADHLRPTLGLLLLQLRHVLRAAAAGKQVELVETRLVVVLREDLVDGAVELGDDRCRRLGRRADRIPGVRDHVRHADLD